MTGRVVWSCTHPGCGEKIAVTVDDGADGSLDPKRELGKLAELAAESKTGNPRIADALLIAAHHMGWRALSESDNVDGAPRIACPRHAKVD